MKKGFIIQPPVYYLELTSNQKVVSFSLTCFKYEMVLKNSFRHNMNETWLITLHDFHCKNASQEYICVMKKKKKLNSWKFEINQIKYEAGNAIKLCSHKTLQSCFLFLEWYYGITLTLNFNCKNCTNIESIFILFELTVNRTCKSWQKIPLLGQLL